MRMLDKVFDEVEHISRPAVKWPSAISVLGGVTLICLSLIVLPLADTKILQNQAICIVCLGAISVGFGISWFSASIFLENAKRLKLSQPTISMNRFGDSRVDQAGLWNQFFAVFYLFCGFALMLMAWLPIGFGLI